MSHRERSDRAMKAVAEGERAFAEGKPREDCPYKISTWGVGVFWQMGWDRASLKARREA